MSTLSLSSTESCYINVNSPSASYYNPSLIQWWGNRQNIAFWHFTAPFSLKYKRVKSARVSITGQALRVAAYNTTHVAITDMASYSNSTLSGITANNYTILGDVSSFISLSATEYLTYIENYPYMLASITLDVTSLFTNGLIDGTDFVLASKYIDYLTSSISSDFGAYPTASLYIEYDDVVQLAPTPSYPVGVYLHESASGTLFTWAWNSSTAATQSAIQLEYKLSTDSDYTVITSTQTGYSYTLNTQLAQGTYNWRIKATNDAGETSDYSDVASFIVIGKPAVPVIDDVPNKALTTISWNASNQCSYEIKIIKDNTTLIHETVSSTDSTYKPNIFLSGAYTVGVAYCNKAGEWSDMAYKTFSISATAPTAPTLEVSAADDAVTLTFTSDYPVAIMRSEEGGDYKIIGKVALTEDPVWVDETVRPGVIYAYKVRAYDAGYADSNVVMARVIYSGAYMASGAMKLHLELSQDAYQTYSETIASTMAATNYAGREYALVEHGEFTSIQISRKYFITLEQRAVLITLSKLNEIYYRDERGNAYMIAITGMSFTEYLDRGFIVTLTFIRTSEDEVIVNV